MSEDLTKKLELEKETVITFVDKGKNKTFVRRYPGELLDLKVYEIITFNSVPEKDSVSPGKYVVKSEVSGKRSGVEFEFDVSGKDRITRYYECHRVNL